MAADAVLSRRLRAINASPTAARTVFALKRLVISTQPLQPSGSPALSTPAGRHQRNRPPLRALQAGGFTCQAARTRPRRALDAGAPCPRRASALRVFTSGEHNPRPTHGPARLAGRTGGGRASPSSRSSEAAPSPSAARAHMLRPPPPAGLGGSRHEPERAPAPSPAGGATARNEAGRPRPTRSSSMNPQRRPDPEHMPGAQQMQPGRFSARPARGATHRPGSQQDRRTKVDPGVDASWCLTLLAWTANGRSGCLVLRPLILRIQGIPTST